MTGEDISAVMAIELRAYPFPWTEGIFRDCLRVGYHCRVLTWSDRIVAYGLVSVAADEAHLLNLCVDPDYQGFGLAKRMLGELLTLAENERARLMFLEVRPSNQAAVQLYQRQGFCEIGRRRGYYPDHNRREDALLMARELFIPRTDG